MLRLGPRAVEAIHAGLTTLQWIALAASVAFNLWAEGIRAFQMQFSPRVVARAAALARMPSPRPLHVALAPLFCMGLIHATRKRLIVGWSVVIGVIGLVTLVR